MPRVLLLFEYPTLNGGERSLLTVLPLLTAHGFTFHALAPADGPLATALAAREIRVRPLHTVDHGGCRLSQEVLRTQIREAVEEIQPQLVHANSLSMGRLAGPVTAQLGLPSLSHLRDIIGLSRQAIADLNQQRRLLAVSQATRAFHIGQGLQADKSFVVYNGIDLHQFRPVAPVGWLHRELAIPADALLIGTIGQLVLRKGHDLLAEAADRLASRHPRLHYVFAGDRFSDKTEAREHEVRIRERFAQGALAGRGHFLGFRTDVPALLPELTLLVHPARQEPLGRVLLEAAASGAPIVVTDVGGTREILPAGAAELVPPNDPTALTAAIDRLVQDAPLRTAYATRAFAEIRQRFTAERSAENLLHHYRELLSQSGPLT